MRKIIDFWVTLNTKQPLITVAIKIVIICVSIYIINKIGQQTIRRFFASDKKKDNPDDQPINENNKKRLTQQSIFITIWRYACYLFTIIAILVILNIQTTSLTALKNNMLTIPLIGKLVQVAVILLLALFGLRLGTLAIETMFNRQRKQSHKIKDLPFFRGKTKLKDGKLRTLETISLSILRYSIYFITIMSILPVFNISITTILTGAGIVGIAIGFGAQNLVRDIVTGTFIIMEDQFDVGDYVEIAGIDGIIEGIGLRTTRLKDFSGVIHYVPNGEISVVSNHSRHFRRAMIDIGVAYEENISKVEMVLNTICTEVQASFPQIKQGPTVMGIQALGESEVVFRVIAHTLPMEQWHIEREMRKAIKARFDEMGIEIPYPRRVVLQQQEDAHD